MLLLTVVFLLVGSLIVGGLATYAVATLRSLPTAKSRSTRVEAVRSAMRMAMTLQRDAGPGACYQDVASYTINGLPVTVTCSSTQAYSTGNDRYGVITTANTDNVAGLRGRTGGSAFIKVVEGKSFFNAGLLSGETIDVDLNDHVEMSRYQSANSPQARYRAGAALPPAGCDDPAIAASDQYSTAPPAHVLTCTDDAWWTRAGDDVNGVREYPNLPAVPTYTRSGPMATIGSCKIFYPGRYLDPGALSLTGTNFFASGIYYFERPVTVAAGATVVFGEGKTAGCVFDTDAAFAPSAPKNHEITGKGATLIMGPGGQFTAAGGAKVTVNRRVSSASTRGSEGQAIRTVSFGVTSPTVEIPQDQVKLSDGSTQPVSAHQIAVGTSGNIARYAASTLGVTGTAVQFDLGAGSRIVIDGYIFTPNAKVVVNGAGGVTDYRVQLTGGIAASNVSLNVAAAPSVASDWYVGMRSETIQRRFDLTATALVGGGTVRSAAAFELHQDKSYAINYWTVDA